MFILFLSFLLIFGCATPSVLDVSPDALDSESPLSSESLEATKNFLQTLSFEDISIDETGVPYLLIPAGHRGRAFLESPESLRAILEVHYTQEFGDTVLELRHSYGLVGQNFVGGPEEGWVSRLDILDSEPKPGILPDLPVTLSFETYLPGDQQVQTTRQGNHILLQTSDMEWVFDPLIIPEEFMNRDLRDIPSPLGFPGAGVFFVFPEILPYESVNLSKLSQGALRVYGPEDQILVTLPSLGGGFYGRGPSAEGFFIPDPDRGAWFPFFEDTVRSTGLGTSLPLRAQVLPETVFFAAPVLGADSYQLLSGGNEVFPLQADSVQSSSDPTFQIPGHSSLVFSALANGRPLIEISYDLQLFSSWPRFVPVDVPDFQGQVMEFPLTNRELASLSTILQDHGIAGGIDSFRELFSSSVLVGLGDLDFGQQFGIETDSESRLVPVTGRENHPAVGVTWQGAQSFAWLLSILSGKTDRIFPSGPTPATEYRLPSETQWIAFSEARPGFRPARGTVNYFRSFDSFEDPNPPHTRMGGPTSPRGTFPPDSLYGLLDTRGNVWEWTLDLVPVEEIPTLATGELDRSLIHRRVLGGAWNSTLPAFGPRGLEVPQGRFAQGQTSWSIGVRLIY